MANQTVDPAALNWFNRAAKRHADELSFRAMAHWIVNKKSASVLSLPASDWIWERQYVDNFPDAKVQFLGLEQNEEVWDRMGWAATKLNQLNDRHEFITTDAPCSFMDFARHTDRKFDVIYLDWMGTWSKDKLKQINIMFDKDMLKNDSIFRLTLGLNRGHPKSWEDLGDVEGDFHIVDIRGGGGELPSWKTHGVPALVEAVGHDFGRPTKLIAAHVYSSFHTRKAAVPEIVFTFRVK